MNSEQIAEILQPLNNEQLIGLGCLIFLSIREETSIQYQRQEWGFTDIPEKTVIKCDVKDIDSMRLVAAMAARILEDLTAIEKAIA